MSQENVELVRRGYQLFIETGDFSLEIAHPDIVWDVSSLCN
jgi:hypothetical protein